MAKRTAQKRTAAVAPKPKPIALTISDDGKTTTAVFSDGNGQSLTVNLDFDALGTAAVAFTSALRTASQVIARKARLQ